MKKDKTESKTSKNNENKNKGGKSDTNNAKSDKPEPKVLVYEKTTGKVLTGMFIVILF